MIHFIGPFCRAIKQGRENTHTKAEILTALEKLNFDSQIASVYYFSFGMRIKEPLGTGTVVIGQADEDHAAPATVNAGYETE